MSDTEVAVLSAENAFTGAPTEATEVEAVRVDALAVDLALAITAHLVEAETQSNTLELSIVPSTEAPEDSEEDDDDDDEFVPKGPNPVPEAGIPKQVGPQPKKPAASTSSTTATQGGQKNDTSTADKNKNKNQSGDTRSGRKVVAVLKKD